MNKKKLTVYELLNLKGKKQIHDVYVNNVEEAIAAEEAGIDMIVTAYGMPQHGIFGTFEDVKRIREAAPNTHLMSAAPEKSYAIVKPHAQGQNKSINPIGFFNLVSSMKRLICFIKYL